jgi:hypothetical protein
MPQDDTVYVHISEYANAQPGDELSDRVFAEVFTDKDAQTRQSKGHRQRASWWRSVFSKDWAAPRACVSRVTASP